MKDRPKWILGILVAAFLLLTPFLFSDFINYLVATLLINMLFATATWAIFHQAGQALFAIAVIGGISGYISAMLNETISNNWVTMAIGVAASCGVGMFFYGVAARVRGHIQFATVNLAFIFVFRYFLVAFTNVTKGIDGIKVKYFTPESFFSTIPHRYWVVLLITVGSLALIYGIMKSRFGKIITLIGRNTDLAASVGINTRKYLIYSYLIFPPFIGLAGVLYSHFLGFISPDTWNPDLSLIMIFCSLIGGSTMFVGPIVGAIIATGIPLYFDVTAEFRFGIVGILAILIFVFKPEGVAGLLGRLFHSTAPKIERKGAAG
jgi:branched-chain amino acid transport system permease protein